MNPLTKPTIYFFVEEDMFEKGIKYNEIIHHKQSLPQRIAPTKPYIYDAEDFQSGEFLSCDIIMLNPTPDKAFSPEELMAYRWFKKKNIENKFTKEQDEVWSNGFDKPLRFHSLFGLRNEPVLEDDIPLIGWGEPSNKPYRFGYDLNMYYPENSNEEISIEEIKWYKLKAANEIMKPADAETTVKAVILSNSLSQSLNLSSQHTNSFAMPPQPTLSRPSIFARLTEPTPAKKLKVPNEASFSYQMESTIDFEMQENECYSPAYLQERTLTENKARRDTFVNQQMIDGAFAEPPRDDDDVGKSIYEPEEELVFDEEEARWEEVTQFLADVTATNEYQIEEIDLNETSQKLDTFMVNLIEMSPFDAEFQKALLDQMGFVESLNGANNFGCTMLNIVPPLKPKQKILMGNAEYRVSKMIGAGSFGKVFSAEGVKTGSMVALKQQRPPHLWEFYVCMEVQQRIQSQRIREGFMHIDFAVIGNNSTIFMSKFAKHGTLLNVCNKVKNATGKSVDEVVVMLIVKQMLTLISSLHAAKFIHADLKPDNLLLMEKLPTSRDSSKIVIQIIDFGQTIDMKRFPSKQMFWHKVKTDNFICTEMLDNKPWSYQFDLFCLASTIYTLVAGKYMVVSRRKPTEAYKPQKLPRYVNAAMWEQIFDTLINIPDPNAMPDLCDLEQLINIELDKVSPRKYAEIIAKFNKALD